MAAKPKSHPFQDLIKAGNKAAIAKALKDPALRKYVPDAILRKQDPKLAASRALTNRMKQPVTPGSPMTEGDLARYGKAAAQVQFGGQETELEQGLRRAGQVQQDTGGYYQQYIDSVRQNAQRIADIQTGAQGQLAGLAASVPQLGNQSLAGVQNPAVQDAQARGATAADFSGLQAAANAARQNVIGSFQAQQQASGAAANEQASNFANTVAPAQKLQALAGAQQKIDDIHKQVTDLKAQMGSADITAREKMRGDERSRIIATATLAGNQANQAATQSAKYGKGGTGLNSYGFTFDQWSKMSTKDQDKYRTKPGVTKPATTGYGPKRPGQNKYGFTYDEWTAMPKAQQDKWRAGKGKDPKEPSDDQKFKQLYGVTPADSGRVATQRNNITTATSALKNTVLSGSAFKKAPKNDATRHKLAVLLQTGAKARPVYDEKNRIEKNPDTGVPKYTQALNPVDALTTSVILDMWQFGGITGGTAIKLHRAGYRIGTLGLPMKPASSSTYVKPPKKATTGSRGDAGG